MCDIGYWEIMTGTDSLVDVSSVRLDKVLSSVDTQKLDQFFICPAVWGYCQHQNRLRIYSGTSLSLTPLGQLKSVQIKAGILIAGAILYFPLYNRDCA